MCDFRAPLKIIIVILHFYTAAADKLRCHYFAAGALPIIRSFLQTASAPWATIIVIIFTTSSKVFTFLQLTIYLRAATAVVQLCNIVAERLLIVPPVSQALITPSVALDGLVRLNSFQFWQKQIEKWKYLCNSIITISIGNKRFNGWMRLLLKTRNALRSLFTFLRRFLRCFTVWESKDESRIRMTRN